MFGNKTQMVESTKALPGRTDPILKSANHFVNGRSLFPPFPEDSHQGLFGMGCFWGAERGFWNIPGVWITAVGYAGGFTPNPTYEEVCSSKTGHSEVVLVVWDPKVVSIAELLKVFWENHDPTQGMQQGNDIGTQYRSCIYLNEPDELKMAISSAEVFGEKLKSAGFGNITTEIDSDKTFYYAEDYHQQYLAKNPNGYCGHGETGVSCPVGLIS